MHAVPLKAKGTDLLASLCLAFSLFLRDHHLAPPHFCSPGNHPLGEFLANFSTAGLSSGPVKFYLPLLYGQKPGLWCFHSSHCGIVNFFISEMEIVVFDHPELLQDLTKRLCSSGLWRSSLAASSRLLLSSLFFLSLQVLRLPLPGLNHLLNPIHHHTYLLLPLTSGGSGVLTQTTTKKKKKMFSQAWWLRP